MGGQVVGEYHRVSDFTFDDQGNRFEKINFFPMPTFPAMTQEDLEDLGGVNPFAWKRPSSVNTTSNLSAKSGSTNLICTCSMWRRK